MEVVGNVALFVAGIEDEIGNRLGFFSKLVDDIEANGIGKGFENSYSQPLFQSAIWCRSIDGHACWDY